LKRILSIQRYPDRPMHQHRLPELRIIRHCGQANTPYSRRKTVRQQPRSRLVSWADIP